MDQLNPMLALAGVLALVVATPVSGQMPSFPDQAMLPTNSSRSAYVAVEYGRGLNDASTKTDTFAGTVGVTVERLSFQGSAGFIASDVDELALGATTGVDLISAPGAPVRLTLQGGVGWMSTDIPAGTLTFLRFPIGLVLASLLSAPNFRVTPWVMPRLNIARASIESISTTTTDFGVSGGLAITLRSGLGLHAAVDALVSDRDNPFIVSLGTHYVFTH